MGEGANQLVDPRTRYLISYFDKVRFEAKHPEYRVVPVSTKRETYLNLMRIEKKDVAAGDAANPASPAAR